MNKKSYISSSSSQYKDKILPQTKKGNQKLIH